MNQLSPHSSTTAIRSVLVANRGEIARRVFATCRTRGIATVAVFSDADVDSPHVHEADAAVHLPGSSPTDTYLRADLVVEAALRAGADAVHPGYGFLSENADFAEQVIAAGLTWIGPDPLAIRVMGSKVESKQRMADAGVPVLERIAPEAVTQEQLPVLVKASSGGGGRGMRVVRSLAEVDEAVASASREAASAFGDPTVFVERYLEAGHHVEVQVMADAHGTVWALGERECSLQRRHQKVIEEAPSPLVDHVGAGMRERLLSAGRDAAAAVGYRGAGTVEFLALPDGSLFFLEMNTRLQVEHPVTESVTGTDLVALQIDVAEGRSLPSQEPVTRGWSIEARLYAEDPADDWRPQTGSIVTLDVPGVVTRFEVAPEHGIRLDSGVEAGSVVGTHYDAMLAKVVSHAPTREEAARELAAALRHSKIHGITTNRDLLVASLVDPEFLAGTADTGFYDRHGPQELTQDAALSPDLAALVAALSDGARQVARRPALGSVGSGYRNVPSSFQRRTFAYGEHKVLVGHRVGRGGLELESPPSSVDRVALVEATPEDVVLDLDGVRRRFAVAWLPGDEELVVVDSPLGSRTLRLLPRYVDPAARAPAGALVAPMPGTIIAVHVAEGDLVEAGAAMLTLEAMKMEHTITAPAPGTVAHVAAVVGQQVDQGATLAVVSDETTPDNDERDAAR
ncbi:acetyl/propionyl-CoA carboxylase subuit alpha [Janibacter sp. Soil728]|uniref:ATP-binding protein n=1 Tax=Janibacter sp. Soil728 TaxID=1736393 RepID=UPI0006F446BF|nr:biotin carboxylase N-terminal domain-containing protein [Janibacter sp. Soil728]KRE38323.1 acetyl/propionyl-CoA carboxylase subuit alpha [Janibacter sp. Soil728]